VKVYVMRHGPAEDVAASGRDFDRALTNSGRDRVRRVADELVRREEAPKVILTSPLVRALQTAEIVASVVPPLEPVTVRREIAPGGDMLDLLREQLALGARRVMVVGHEPDVSTLVANLVPGWTAGFEKGMVVGLRMRAGEPAELRFFHDPKLGVWKS
jgi:phosphohistidine phosphatase